MFLVSRWLSVSNRASFSLERHSSFVRIRTGANAEPIKPENSPTPCSMQKAEDVLGGSVCVCVASASDLLITCCVPAPVPACCSSPAVGRPFSVLLFPFFLLLSSLLFFRRGEGFLFFFLSFFFSRPVPPVRFAHLIRHVIRRRPSVSAAIVAARRSRTVSFRESMSHLNDPLFPALVKHTHRERIWSPFFVFVQSPRSLFRLMQCQQQCE